jgi:hypothetical protein
MGLPEPNRWEPLGSIQGPLVQADGYRGYVISWCPSYTPISAVSSVGGWLHATSASGWRAPATEHILIPWSITESQAKRALPSRALLRYILAAQHVRQLVFTHRLGQRDQASVVLAAKVVEVRRASKIGFGKYIRLEEMGTAIGGATGADPS